MSANRGSTIAGQKVLLHGKPAEIRAVYDHGGVAIVQERGLPRLFEREVFEAMREQGTIRYVSDHGYVSTDGLEVLTEAERREIRRREAYVIKLLCAEHPGAVATRQAVIREVADELGDPKPPAPTTLYEWMRLYVASDGHPMSLHRPGKGRGNRGRRLSAYALELLTESIEHHYLTRHQRTKKAAYRRFEALWRSRDRKEPTPTYKTYCRHITALDPVVVTAARFGPAAAQRILRSDSGGLKTRHVLERVELDGTRLPVLLLSDDLKTIVGRAYLIAVRDHHCKGITGYFWHLGGESAIAAIQALRCAILPKESFHRKFKHVRHRWSMSGLPVLLVYDASSGFQSHDFEALTLSLGISVQTTTVRRPWLKGTVESVMQTLQEELRDLPGALVPRDRSLPSDWKAVRDACITVSRFERLLATTIVDIINPRPSEIDGLDSYDRWGRSVAQVPPCEPDCLPNLFQFGTKRVHRVIHEHKGMTYEYLWWNSSQLQALRRRLPPGTKLTLRLNVEDLGYAFVEDPTENRTLRVPSTRPEITSGLTLRELEQMRKIIRAQYNGHPAHEALRLAYGDIRREADEAYAERQRQQRENQRPQSRERAPALPLDPSLANAERDNLTFADVLTEAAELHSADKTRILPSNTVVDGDTDTDATTSPTRGGFDTDLSGDDGYDVDPID